jgi:hypothetical protein
MTVQLPAEMSDYDRKAWTDATDRLARQRAGRVRKAVSVATGPVKQVASGAWNRVPTHDGLEAQVSSAMAGMKAVTFDPALRSVDAEKVLRRRGASSRGDLFELDMKKLDRSLPGLRTLYSGTAFVEGGGSALVVTGAEVSATVSGGVTLGVAAAAIAADAVVSMALMGRIIGRVAAEYGYDVRLPEEEVFALGVMSLGTAATAAESTVALANLRRLTAVMMRQPTWAELNKHALVRMIDRVFGLLGEKLVKRKLAQAVPVAGAFINAGLSAHMADQTYRRARDAYRLRFLAEKYGIDPEDWIAADTEIPADELLSLELDDLETPELDGIEGTR